MADNVAWKEKKHVRLIFKKKLSCFGDTWKNKKWENYSRKCVLITHEQGDCKKKSYDEKGGFDDV